MKYDYILFYIILYYFILYYIVMTSISELLNSEPYNDLRRFFTYTIKNYLNLKREDIKTHGNDTKLNLIKFFQKNYKKYSNEDFKKLYMSFKNGKSNSKNNKTKKSQINSKSKSKSNSKKNKANIENLPDEIKMLIAENMTSGENILNIKKEKEKIEDLFREMKNLDDNIQNSHEQSNSQHNRNIAKQLDEKRHELESILLKCHLYLTHENNQQLIDKTYNKRTTEDFIIFLETIKSRYNSGINFNYFKK